MKAFATKHSFDRNILRTGSKAGSTPDSNLKRASIVPTIAGVLHRKSRCPCGGGCPHCKAESSIQPKLKIGAPNDQYEQEADRVAEQVMRMPDHEIAGVSHTPMKVQRKCAACASGDGLCPDCEKEEEASLQRAPAAAASMNSAPTIVHDVLRSSGQPLDPATRAFMEPRFGQDFSQVRVHTNSQAAESARAVNARAYTVGHDMIFGATQYASNTNVGRSLLAHELTHVVQQSEVGKPRLQRAILDKFGCTRLPDPTTGILGCFSLPGPTGCEGRGGTCREPVPGGLLGCWCELPSSPVPVPTSVLPLPTAPSHVPSPPVESFANLTLPPPTLTLPPKPSLSLFPPGQAPQLRLCDLSATADPMSDISTFQSPGASGWWGAKFGCYRNNCTRRHRGWDIHASVGTESRAVVAGTMTHHEDPGGYGHYVKLTSLADPTLVYVYAHLSARELAGTYCAGEKLGETGTSGNADANRPHLHFEVQVNNVAGDPSTHFTQPAQVIEATGSTATAINPTAPAPCVPC